MRWPKKRRPSRSSLRLKLLAHEFLQLGKERLIRVKLAGGRRTWLVHPLLLSPSGNDLRRGKLLFGRVSNHLRGSKVVLLIVIAGLSRGLGHEAFCGALRFRNLRRPFRDGRIHARARRGGLCPRSAWQPLTPEEPEESPADSRQGEKDRS